MKKFNITEPPYTIGNSFFIKYDKLNLIYKHICSDQFLKQIKNKDHTNLHPLPFFD